MKAHKRIPHKRATPRRKRPDLFYIRPSAESWEQISLRIRQQWWAEKFGQLRCGICGRLIYTWADLVPDHIVPGKMGGCKDNSDANLQPAHVYCNNEKGSRRNFSKILEQRERA